MRLLPAVKNFAPKHRPNILYITPSDAALNQALQAVMHKLELPFLEYKTPEESLAHILEIGKEGGNLAILCPHTWCVEERAYLTYSLRTSMSPLTEHLTNPLMHDTAQPRLPGLVSSPYTMAQVANLAQEVEVLLTRHWLNAALPEPRAA